MKKLLILLLFASFYSCSKPEADYRDPLIGKWRGTWSYETPYYHQSGGYSYRCFTPGYEYDDLHVETNWGLQAAQLFQTTYTYVPFEKATSTLTTNGGVMTIVTFYGSGQIKGDTLYETGKLKFTVNMIEYTGTWQSKLVKDK